MGFQGVGFRGFKLRVEGVFFEGLGLRVSSFGFRVPGFGFRVSGFGFRTRSARRRTCSWDPSPARAPVSASVSGLGFDLRKTT